ELAVDSVPQEGTTVTVSVPIGKSQVTDGGDTTQLSRTVHALRILIIDDEASVRIGLSTLLEEPGYSVPHRPTLAEATALARERTPHVLLSDFRLHDDDSGLKVIAAVRKIAPAVHSVLITGDTAPERLVEAQTAGVRVLHKPVSLEVLTRELSS